MKTLTTTRKAAITKLLIARFAFPADGTPEGDKWHAESVREITASVHDGDYDGDGPGLWIDHEHGVPGMFGGDDPGFRVTNWWTEEFTPAVRGILGPGYFECANAAVTYWVAELKSLGGNR